MRNIFASFGIVAALALVVACGGSADESSEPTGTERDSVDPELTPLAEAQQADRLETAVSLSETVELRYYPDDIASFDLDQTEALQVTVEEFVLGRPPACGPDEFLSVCDGSVSPVYVVFRADNPNDTAAPVPEVGVLSPNGQQLSGYACPDSDRVPAGSEMLPTTTVTFTLCFGSETSLQSLSGWLVKANTIGLIPDEGAEAYWIHE